MKADWLAGGAVLLGLLAIAGWSACYLWAPWWVTLCGLPVATSALYLAMRVLGDRGYE